MKRITPLFPDQSSIDDALKHLNNADRLRYNDLLEQYKKEISRDADHIDHAKIAELIAEAQEILKG